MELRGFEPLTPSMRTRCATRLRYSPENLSKRSKLCRLLVPGHLRPDAAYALEEALASWPTVLTETGRRRSAGAVICSSRRQPDISASSCR